MLHFANIDADDVDYHSPAIFAGLLVFGHEKWASPSHTMLFIDVFMPSGYHITINAILFISVTLKQLVLLCSPMS